MNIQRENGTSTIVRVGKQNIHWQRRRCATYIPYFLKKVPGLKYVPLSNKRCTFGYPH